MTVVKVLSGHISQETAFVIASYPYGRSLRCKKRMWVDVNAKNGERVVSQTTDPRVTSREFWNAEKKSTYSLVMALYLDENDHVQVAAMPGSTLIYSVDDATEKKIDEFYTTFSAGFTDHAKQVWETTKKLRAGTRAKRENKE